MKEEARRAAARGQNARVGPDGAYFRECGGGDEFREELVRLADMR
jgi:hypothetical protein